MSPPALRGGTLYVGFGGLRVAIRSDAPAVLEPAARIFGHMLTAASTHTVGRLEISLQGSAYQVSGDASVTVEDGSLDDILRCVRYGVIQLFVQARPDLLWLHAGAVACRGRVVLFPGGRGCGKSTLVTSLCGRGWGYLSDDVVPLDPASASALPFPQAPARREFPGQDMPDEWLRGYNKIEVPLAKDRVCTEAMPVDAVVFLTSRPGLQAELRSRSPAATALHLLEQCWNFADHREAAVGSVCALAQRVPGFSLSFGDGEAAADVVARELQGRL